MSTSARPLPPRLMLITDPETEVLEVTAAALARADGRVAVQLREKGASARRLAELGHALAGICHASGAQLIINDRADVARAVGGGVHLPEAGLSVGEARKVLGPGALIGCSRHDRAGLDRAAEAGADYATLAPIHVVPGKGAPLGVEGFDVAGLATPVLALGGIDAAHVASLMAAGAWGVAVCRAVARNADPAAAVERLLDALGDSALGSSL